MILVIETGFGKTIAHIPNFEGRIACKGEYVVYDHVDYLVNEVTTHFSNNRTLDHKVILTVEKS